MAIDERAVVNAVAGLGIRGNDEGMIPAFGLYLTKHFADYYNRISFATARRMEAAGLAEDGERLLVEAGHVCAFNTFGGIMQSAEWDAVVKPMIQTREDWIHGMVAVVNAFGWGRWRVRELRANEELRIEIDHAYECTGWTRDYGLSKASRCYLATGGAAGLMNLLYVGDITDRPTLDEAYYRQLFRGESHFVGRETYCTARGDSRCEIVARRP